jgi:hypothetical protein
MKFYSERDQEKNYKLHFLNQFAFVTIKNPNLCGAILAFSSEEFCSKGPPF